MNKDERIAEIEKENAKLKTRDTWLVAALADKDDDERITELEKENRELKQYIDAHLGDGSHRDEFKAKTIEDAAGAYEKAKYTTLANGGTLEGPFIWLKQYAQKLRDKVQ